MSIIDNIKSVAEVVRKADNIDLYRQILDLNHEALELVEENIKLKNELRELQDNADIQSKLKFRENMYYLVDTEGEDGPFCSTCWDYNRKMVRMHENMYELYVCPICVK